MVYYFTSEHDGSRYTHAQARRCQCIAIAALTVEFAQLSAHSCAGALSALVRCCQLGRRAEQYTLYMGRDKIENEDLIKFGWPMDVWSVAATTSRKHASRFRAH